MTQTVRMSARVDSERCVGHGRCYVFAPDVFEPDDEGYSTVLRTAPGPDQYDAVRSAARNCPEQAVIVAETFKDVVQS